MPSASSSRQSIHQLSSQLANQIAAGEVVERPASVIKELLENSLDAGATLVDIDVQAGGTQSIRIRDNGYGIPKDELPLALSPHATSKIRSLDDLIKISSMGFRGEALASIASVSELILTSQHQEMAWSIKSKEGQYDLTPASHPVGTTVEVNNLFYSTPARRKFLKAERTEYRHIEDVVKGIALSRFDVAFNFRHNQRQVFSLSVASSNENKLERLRRLINKEFIQAAVELNFKNAGLKLSGWLATGEYSRSQSDMQYFFVNGRMIRDKLITHAVRQAFQDTLYPGRFPVYVLHLDMDAEQVDVNVHPTKHEVRFRQSRLIHDFLFYSLRDALTQEGKVSSKNEIIKSAEAFQGFNSNSYPASFNSSAVVAESTAAYSSSAYQNVLNKDAINKPLGIAIAKFKGYLLTQNNQGLLVVALKQALSELYEMKIKDSLAEQDNLISKPVLIPFSLSVNCNAESWINKHNHKLNQLGFEFAVLGESEIMVRQVPAMLNAIDIKESLKQFIKMIINHQSDYSEALIKIMLSDEISHDPATWNKLLRDLEANSLDERTDLYHQVSEKDFSCWFNLD